VVSKHAARSDPREGSAQRCLFSEDDWEWITRRSPPSLRLCSSTTPSAGLRRFVDSRLSVPGADAGLAGRLAVVLRWGGHRVELPTWNGRGMCRLVNGERNEPIDRIALEGNSLHTSQTQIALPQPGNCPTTTEPPFRTRRSPHSWDQFRMANPWLAANYQPHTQPFRH
jgi:hypothetical protein